MGANIIKKSDLSLSLNDKVVVGSYLYDRERLYVVTTIDDEGAVLDEVNPITLEVAEDSWYRNRKVSQANLEEYYKTFGTDVKEVKRLAERLLNGENVEDFTESDDMALMSLGSDSKNTLVALRESVGNAMAVAESVRKYAEILVQQKTKELMARLQPMREMVEKMQREVKRLDYVIQTIETYAGIKESVVQLRQGEPSAETTPIVFRQAVIFMDEEMALIEDDFDWQKVDKFDSWLLENDRFKDFLPEEKSMVAVKPRRTDKQYTKGETLSDRWYNWVMNEGNRQTAFLIRNGDNLYKIESEHVFLTDRMFPNPNEYAELVKKANEESRFSSSIKGFDNTEVFRKQYTQVAFLMQGLIDRSDVFAPHKVSGSIINLEGFTDAQIQLRYELDMSRALGDGRPTVKDWITKVNENLCEGKRIVLIPQRYGIGYGYDFDRDYDFMRYYRSSFSAPELPTEGIYTLEAITESQANGYMRCYDFAIKYKPTNDVYRYWDETPRKQRVSIRLQVKPRFGSWVKGVLNYDDVKIEDVEYYLNSRLHRSQYYNFVCLLKKFKDLYLKEMDAESEYIKMFVSQIMARGLKVKDGYTPNSVVKVAIDTIKSRLKWKRPITAKEKETYTLVERTLFSQAFRTKYFR